MKNYYGNRIHGYVVMPNHLHVLLYISECSPAHSNKTELLKIFADAAEITKGAKHKIFADRFDCKEMLNADMFREKLNCIHNNPCTYKWRLAKKPERL